MSLIKRKVTAAMSRANRANSRRSTGPRTERGKAVASRNLPRPRLFSKAVAHSMAALGERPEHFEQMHTALSTAMAPRDAWEAAWVQDIAILRWRLERLQRAELAEVALRRRRQQNQRRRAAYPPTGSKELGLKGLLGMVGFTGLPDSAFKFQHVLEYLNQLRNVVLVELFDDDITANFQVLYGKELGFHGALLKRRFDALAKSYQEGHPEAAAEGRKSLLADLSKEIEEYEELQALYAAEHLQADPVQLDADLRLPGEELDGIIRYETHLEDQIERKLRQFYARRRESVIPRAEALPAAEEVDSEAAEVGT